MFALGPKQNFAKAPEHYSKQTFRIENQCGLKLPIGMKPSAPSAALLSFNVLLGMSAMQREQSVISDT